jgi:hypothetical protein
MTNHRTVNRDLEDVGSQNESVTATLLMPDCASEQAGDQHRGRRGKLEMALVASFKDVALTRCILLGALTPHRPSVGSVARWLGTT